jgi:hypothetical protein
MSGARRFEELVSWQRMHELNIEVWNAMERGRVFANFLDFPGRGELSKISAVTRRQTKRRAPLSASLHGTTAETVERFERPERPERSERLNYRGNRSGMSAMT